jgi:polyphosphate glucokinase
MRFGAGKDNMGLVLLITIGTGIGTAMFYKGELIPNTEFGHVIWKNKKPAEAYCSSGARERLKISRKEWARRFNDYLHHLERILSPDLFILGGGESKLFDSYKQHLNPNCPVVPAQLLNNAGIIGAAVYASEIV